MRLHFSLVFPARPRVGSRGTNAETFKANIGANKMKMIKNFLRDESGMETLEYAVIAGLIAVAAAVIYAKGGTWALTIQNRLQNAAAQS